MQALRYSDETGLQLQTDCPLPADADGEAVIAIHLAGICSTDLEILKGYVPGYAHVLGHEFVGTVQACASRPELVGKRVVGEINCPSDTTDSFMEDPVRQRNHYPRRTVLGIIGRDGAMATHTSLPAGNLWEVPDSLTDEEAVFAEPVAAACRILEQQVIKRSDRVAVVGDGKLGLLVAQLLALQTAVPPVHFGRHQAKLGLVEGTEAVVLPGDADDPLPPERKQAFDVCVEATGSSQGILLAVALVRPLGTVVQKSTCSAVGDAAMPQWSEIANQIVVDEKRLVGSRCGPFPPALQALQVPQMRRLVRAMVDQVFPISRGEEAIACAQQKGCLKVLLDMRPAAAAAKAAA